MRVYARFRVALYFFQALLTYALDADATMLLFRHDASLLPASLPLSAIAAIAVSPYCHYAADALLLLRHYAITHRHYYCLRHAHIDAAISRQLPAICH